MNNYRDILVQQVKDAGQDIIDMAELMVPEGITKITDFTIYVSFDPEVGLPKISWTVDTLCNNTWSRLMEGDDD